MLTQSSVVFNGEFKKGLGLSSIPLLCHKSQTCNKTTEKNNYSSARKKHHRLIFESVVFSFVLVKYFAESKM